MFSYVVITPVRNEEKFIRKTLDSVTTQTVLPKQWIIVNDGSIDKTASILEEYAVKFPWITLNHRLNIGHRAGKGPAQAFNEGLKSINCNYDFIVNLDGDVSFDKGYFELLLEEFRSNQKLGIASGKSYYLENGKLILHRTADYSTMGPSKVYRKECFKEIGGRLEEHICWDMVDDIKAQMRGWETISFSDIKFIHYKRIGAKQGSGIGPYINEGKILYHFGYHPFFLILKILYRSFEPPYLLRTCGVFLGFFKDLFKNMPQIEDKEMIEFLQQSQMRVIFGQKPLINSFKRIENKNYIVVSPVRDEEELVEKTIKSMIAQTVKPLVWILVNDGSNDKTKEIVLSYKKENPWIQIIDREDRGFRLPGKGIVDAFYEGFEKVQDLPWNFVVKLDCDLSFDPDYFERIIGEFEKNSSMGISSGKTFLPINNDVKKLKLEWCPDTCTRGPCKIYKRECFEKIGGIRRERGWDTMDDIAAMVEGYSVRSFYKYQLIHYRPIGRRTNTDKGVKDGLRKGSHFYYLGYHPLFMFLKSLKMCLTDKPFLLAGMAIMFSFFISWVRHEKQIDNPQLVKKLQELQLSRIFKLHRSK